MRIHLSCLFLTLTIGAYCQTWDTAGCGLYKYGATVNAFAVYKNELYVGGDFYFTGNQEMVNCIARWNERKWDSVGNGVYGHIKALTVYNNDLYAGGDFYKAGRKSIYKIAKWDGNKWDSVGSGLNHNPLRHAINCMAVYNDELYVGGGFDSAGGKYVCNMAKWNGKEWTVVANGIGLTFYQEVLAMVVYKDQLYISTVIPGLYHDSCNVLRLDNGEWKIIYAGYGSIETFAVYQDELYAGGRALDTNGGNNLIKWNNSKWLRVGKGLMEKGWSQSGSISSMIVFGNELYIGGRFDFADTVEVKNIAKYDGKKFIRAGDGLYGGISKMALYNDGFYVAGGFHYEPHNKVFNGIAVWYPSYKN